MFEKRGFAVTLFETRGNPVVYAPQDGGEPQRAR